MLSTRVSQLIAKGEWLTDIELKVLYFKCLKCCVDMMEKITDRVFTTNEALQFQSHLIVLFMLANGGQRKQVTTLFIYSNMQFAEEHGCYFYQPLLEKKVRPQMSEGIPIPKYLGDLIIYFWMTVRPSLTKLSTTPTDHWLTPWVNTKGKLIEAYTLTDLVITLIDTYFKGKHVTPATFRREIATLSFEKKLALPGATPGEFMKSLAFEMNTSEVILLAAYNRASASLEAKVTQEVIATGLLMDEENTQLCERVTSTLAANVVVQAAVTTTKTLTPKDKEKVKKRTAEKEKRMKAKRKRLLGSTGEELKDEKEKKGKRERKERKKGTETETEEDKPKKRKHPKVAEKQIDSNSEDSNWDPNGEEEEERNKNQSAVLELKRTRSSKKGNKGTLECIRDMRVNAHGVKSFQVDWSGGRVTWESEATLIQLNYKKKIDDYIELDNALEEEEEEVIKSGSSKIEQVPKKDLRRKLVLEFSDEETDGPQPILKTSDNIKRIIRRRDIGKDTSFLIELKNSTVYWYLEEDLFYVWDVVQTFIDS